MEGSLEPMWNGDLSRLIVGAVDRTDIPMTHAKVRISKDGLESESALYLATYQTHTYRAMQHRSR